MTATEQHLCVLVRRWFSAQGSRIPLTNTELLARIGDAIHTELAEYLPEGYGTTTRRCDAPGPLSNVQCGLEHGHPGPHAGPPPNNNIGWGP